MSTSRHLAASLAVSAALAAGLAAPASAADLPSRRAPPPVVALPPAFTWTGFYVGANAGGFFGSDGRFTDRTFGVSVSQPDSRSGFIGGGQVGYNYQFTPGSGFVIGVEADVQGLAGTTRDRGLTVGTVPFVSTRPSLDWLGTARARVGYAFDRFLVYGTGGLAYGGGSRAANVAAYPYGLPDTTRLGYAAGAGVEYAVTPNVSVKVEGLYVNLGKANGDARSVYDAATAAYYGPGRRNEDLAIARAGVNYRF